MSKEGFLKACDEVGDMHTFITQKEAATIYEKLENECAGKLTYKVSIYIGKFIYVLLLVVIVK